MQLHLKWTYFDYAVIFVLIQSNHLPVRFRWTQNFHILGQYLQKLSSYYKSKSHHFLAFF